MTSGIGPLSVSSWAQLRLDWSSQAAASNIRYIRGMLSLHLASRYALLSICSRWSKCRSNVNKARRCCKRRLMRHCSSVWCDTYRIVIGCKKYSITNTLQIVLCRNDLKIRSFKYSRTHGHDGNTMPWNKFVPNNAGPQFEDNIKNVMNPAHIPGPLPSWAIQASACRCQRGISQKVLIPSRQLPQHRFLCQCLCR